MKSDLPAILRYEEARRALAEVHRVDEVKSIRDKAIAMQVYANQAKDREMMDLATKIRMRAEIRAGELLIEMKARGERDAGAGDRQSAKAKSQPATQLADLGVSKTQSSRWQRLAALPPEDQEEAIEKAQNKAQAVIDPPAKEKGVRYTNVPKLTTPQDDCIATIVRLVSECAHKISPDKIDVLFNELSLSLDHLHATLRKTHGHHPERKSA